MKISRIFDIIFAIVVIIAGVVFAHNSIEYYNAGFSKVSPLGFEFILIYSILAIVALIHIVYGLTPVERSRLSKTTLVLLIAFPIAILALSSLLEIVSSADGFGLGLMFAGALVAGEGGIILLHLISFLRDCSITYNERKVKNV